MRLHVLLQSSVCFANSFAFRTRMSFCGTSVRGIHPETISKVRNLKTNQKKLKNQNQKYMYATLGSTLSALEYVIFSPSNLRGYVSSFISNTEGYVLSSTKFKEASITKLRSKVVVLTLRMTP